VVTITNKEIYNKLLDIEKQTIITNGKVKLNRWIATTALTLVVTIIFIIAVNGGIK
jgi:hypothetical protein